ncbi:Vibriobactin-specific isochorismatase [Thalassoglobus neptunius]|uniref:Vibriobactin-specific isochorismatase n=1 Tax=Thalassoglobus neptunius TaxID=1938619 RepID=A0A5C5WXW9_9PLAN|nr:hydrolase [Thalassoglobus neptunius]TWT55448.1 Vibriobactin-specific isochorismatase [Thalassoglobus neptunius]
MRSPQLMDRSTSRLVVVDMQEKLLPVVERHSEILRRTLQLVRAAQILDVPTTATEQYPRGLGGTVAELAEAIPNRPEKLQFSAAECLDGTSETILSEARHQIVLAGIETHVCVLQTALDLSSKGFNVFVVADAVGSRTAEDKSIALKRISDEGIQVVSTEMVLFEWCEVAGTDEFKQISKLVTNRD